MGRTKNLKNRNRQTVINVNQFIDIKQSMVYYFEAGNAFINVNQSKDMKQENV